jgi:hypothetical protein
MHNDVQFVDRQLAHALFFLSLHSQNLAASEVCIVLRCSASVLYVGS